MIFTITLAFLLGIVAGFFLGRKLFPTLMKVGNAFYSVEEILMRGKIAILSEDKKE